MANKISTWSEINWGIESSNQAPAKKYARWVIMTIAACSTALLAACTQQAQAQDSKSEVLKTAQLSQAVQPKVINASFSTPETPTTLDITTLTKDQILKEIEAVEIKIAKLEAGMDSFTDDDSRWDVLDGYTQERDKLRDAQLEESWKRAEESCKIAKALWWECAE